MKATPVSRTIIPTKVMGSEGWVPKSMELMALATAKDAMVPAARPMRAMRRVLDITPNWTCSRGGSEGHADADLLGLAGVTE